MRIAPILTALAAVTCSLLGGCFEDSTPQHSGILPLDYQTTFFRLRECRAVPDHDNSQAIVLVNAIASDAYAARGVLPAGSIVVAEEYNDPWCGSLVGYYLMAKEQPGYDPAAGDWHWQRLDRNQRIQQDGRMTACSSCHAKAPCSDFLCSTP